MGESDVQSYHARLARVKIIAQVVDEQSFWRAPPERQAEVLRMVAATGVVAIASPPPADPGTSVSEDWKRVGPFVVHFFPRPPASRSAPPNAQRLSAVR